MGLISVLFGQDPSNYEMKGDRYLDTSNWGSAKLEFEKAIDALQKRQPDEHSLIRLKEKLKQAKEGLALDHMKAGQNLSEQGYYGEAGELFQLAKELSQDMELISVIENLMLKLECISRQNIEATISDSGMDKEFSVEEHEEEYFLALCGTLPKEIQGAYVSYGEPFRSGYLALNRGEFESAVDLLSRAMDGDCPSNSYIPLELASAYINLGRFDEAQCLLKKFVQNHPVALPGYQLLCEVFWELKAFEEAESLLNNCPDELRNSSAYYLLRGETMFQSGRYGESISFYRDVLQKYGWNEAMSRALARSFEIVGELEDALGIYGKIMNQCGDCQSRIDPFIKGKFADISISLGHYSSTVLEMYLSLAGEDPENAAHYYEKVSEIYSSRGNNEEAHRFQLISQQLQNEKGS